MLAWRVVLAVLGLSGIGYGVSQLLLHVSPADLTRLAIWLVAAVLLVDLVLGPGLVGVGWLLRRWVPDRGRRYLQTGLIVAAMVTVIALPMIGLQGGQPPAKALLVRDYRVSLAVLLVLVALGTGLAYALRVRRDRADGGIVKDSAGSTRQNPSR
jgi:hypothetical protein